LDGKPRNVGFFCECGPQTLWQVGYVVKGAEPALVQRLKDLRGAKAGFARLNGKSFEFGPRHSEQMQTVAHKPHILAYRGPRLETWTPNVP
jgi:hypothetical protein